MKFSIKTVLEKPFLVNYGRLLLLLIVGGIIGLAILGNHYLSSKDVSQNTSNTTPSTTPNIQKTTTTTPITTPTIVTQSPSTQTTTTTTPNQSTVTPLHTAQEDPVFAWVNNYDQEGSGIVSKLSNDVNNVDSVITQCGTTTTSNIYYSSFCTPSYNAASTLSLCETLRNDTTTAEGYPAIPDTIANNDWQGALSAFGVAAQMCITNINADNLVGPDEVDVGSTIKSTYAPGINLLSLMESEITTYEEQWSCNNGLGLCQ